MTEIWIERKQKAYQLFLSGLGYKAASHRLGLKEYTVRDWFRNFRAGINVCNLSRNDFSQELRQKVVSLRRAGFSWTEITEVTKVPKTKACYWVRQELNNFK